MAPTLQKATKEDVPTLISIFLTSFQDPITRGVFPQTSRAVIAFFTDALTKELDDPGAVFLKIVQDDVDGTVLGFAKWNTPVAALELQELVRKVEDAASDGERWALVQAEMPAWPARDGKQAVNAADEVSRTVGWQDAANRFFGGLLLKRLQWMSSAQIGREGYYYLEMLGVVPGQQGRGLGRMLIDWGTEQADRDGKLAYLEASPKSVRLYERAGFVGVGEVYVDLTDLAAEGTYFNKLMVRLPR